MSLDIKKIFEGRLGRVEFFLVSLIVSFFYTLISAIPYASYVFILVFSFLAFSMLVRRAHDSNKNFVIPLILIISSVVSSFVPLILGDNIFIIMGIISVINIILVILYLILLFSIDKKDNKYGKFEKNRPLKNAIFGNLFDKQNVPSNIQDLK